MYMNCHLLLYFSKYSMYIYLFCVKNFLGEQLKKLLEPFEVYCRKGLRS